MLRVAATVNLEGRSKNEESYAEIRRMPQSSPMNKLRFWLLVLGIGFLGSGCNTINYTLERSEYLEKCSSARTRENTSDLFDYCINKPKELDKKYGNPPPTPLW